MAIKTGFGAVSGLLDNSGTNNKFHSVVIKGRGVIRINSICASYFNPVPSVTYDQSKFRGGRLIVILDEYTPPNTGIIEPISAPITGNASALQEQALGSNILFDSGLSYGRNFFDFSDSNPLFGQQDRPITVILSCAYQDLDINQSPSTFMGRLSVIGDIVYQNVSDRKIKIKEI